MKRCAHCGKENRDEAQFCGHCGRQSTTDTPKQPNAVSNSVRQVPSSRTAALLSCLWPGLGQIYNGEILRGAAFAILHFFLWTWQFFVHVAILAGKTTQEIMLEALQSPEETVAPWQFILSVLVFFGPPTAFWIYGMVDAKRGAEGGIVSSVFPRSKVVTSFASGIVVGLLLAVPFLVRNPESSKVPTTERMQPAKVEPNPAEPIHKVSDTERPEPADVALKAMETVLGVPASEPPKPAKVDSMTKEAARRKLEEIHIPYTEEALFGEASNGNVETVELLLAAGMSPNSGHVIGGPALLEAAEKGHTEIVQLLLADGADVNAKDNSGRTALMCAAQKGHTEIVKALIDKGAYVNAQSYFGSTALSSAGSRSNPDIVQLLKQAGARE